MIVNKCLRENISNTFWISKKLIYNRGKDKTGNNEKKEIKILKIDDNINSPSSFNENTEVIKKLDILHIDDNIINKPSYNEKAKTLKKVY